MILKDAYPETFHLFESIQELEAKAEFPGSFRWKDVPSGVSFYTCRLCRNIVDLVWADERHDILVYISSKKI